MIKNEANVKISYKEDTPENRKNHPHNNPDFRLSVSNGNHNMQMVRSHLNSP